MSRSFIAIALCFSVMGMTAVPARYMPCCCKGAGRNLRTEAVRTTCCPVAVKTDETADKRRGHHACSANQKSSPPAVCCQHAQATRSMFAGEAITGPAHNCRCIQEMQIVAIPGFAVSEKAYRLIEVNAPVAETPTITPAERRTESLTESGFPGIVITLQTCSFRC